MEKSIFNPSYRSDQARVRHEMPPDKYLADVRKYMHDAVSLCLAQDVRKPLNFFSSYFANVASGDNVLFRKFKYVSCTPCNRRSFIRIFNQTFAHFNEEDALTPESLHQLLCLLCPDFPFSLVRNASRITLDTPAQQIPFKDLSSKLFILFFFSEFMNQAALAFRTIDSHGTGSVPKQIFYAHLAKIIDTKKYEFSCPRQEVVRDVLVGDGAADEALLKALREKDVADCGPRPKKQGDKPVEKKDTDKKSEAKDTSLIMFSAFCVKLFSHAQLQEALRATPSYRQLKKGIGQMVQKNANQLSNMLNMGLGPNSSCP